MILKQNWDNTTCHQWQRKNIITKPQQHFIQDILSKTNPRNNVGLKLLTVAALNLYMLLFCTSFNNNCYCYFVFYRTRTRNMKSIPKLMELPRCGSLALNFLSQELVRYKDIVFVMKSKNVFWDAPKIELAIFWVFFSIFSETKFFTFSSCLEEI